MKIEVDQEWVPRKGRYPDNAFVVHDVSQTRVCVHPTGGGPEVKWDLDEFAEEFRPVAQDEQKSPRPGVFSLDGVDLAIAGWTTGETWNGWSKPILEASLFGKFAEHTNLAYPGVFVTRHGDGAVALADDLVNYENAEECWVKPEAFTPPGGSEIRVYRPDNGWTWWEHDEFEIAYLEPSNVLVPAGFPIKIGGGVVGDG